MIMKTIMMVMMGLVVMMIGLAESSSLWMERGSSLIQHDCENRSDCDDDYNDEFGTNLSE